MRNLLRADLYRLCRTKWLRLALLFMAVTSLCFIAIQYAGMDYTVSADRVIFLPMAFYGLAAAALVSLLTGEDFNDGVIKNKLISGAPRNAVYCSALLTSALGCILLYLFTLAITVPLGLSLFAINVTAGEIVSCALLGLLTCLAYAGIFTMISMLAGNRSVAAVVCMGLSFLMLFLCLHTNQVLVQKAYIDGAPNPAYADGAKRLVYGLLHDLNPTGQAAQLSSMEVLNAARYASADLFWMLLSVFGGARIFRRQDIR